MIRTGQHRRIPRQSYLGDQGWGLVNTFLDGLGFVLFLAAVVLASQYWPHLRAWVHDIHVAIMADGHALFLK